MKLEDVLKLFEDIDDFTDNFTEKDFNNLVNQLIDNDKFGLTYEDLGEALLEGLGFDIDEDGELIFYGDDDDDIDEAFIKKSAGERLKNNRKQKLARKKATVKNDLKARAKKAATCGKNKRVTKVGPRIYKCVALKAKDKRKRKILKKWHKVYGH